MRKLFLLLLLALSLNAQVPVPAVKTTGPIGTGGPAFPFFNNGTINMTSNTYTMAYPDQSASVIRVTGTLTAAGTIIAPQPMGFEFVIINATAGGFPVTLQGTGTGVSVPNNTAVMVVSDGVNYIQVGSAGGNISFPGTGNALLQANTTGTVSRLTTNPTQCPPGVFAIGINVDGSANCLPASIPISNLLAATHTNTLYNGTYQQLWSWHFPSTVTNSSGLALTEQDLGVGTGNSVVTISSFAGSPTTALTVNGPLNLSLIRSAPALGTDPNGNIIPTTPGVGPGGGPTFPVRVLNTTSTTPASATDFLNCTTFVITAGTPTLQLPTPAPTNGQCVTLVNYTAAAAAISRAGSEQINGVASNLGGLSGNGQLAPSTWRIYSDGTNYIMSKGFSGSITNLSSGTIGAASQITVGTAGQVVAPSTNTGNNGTVNGTRWNATTSTLQVIGNNTATAGTTANVAASGNITSDTGVYSPSYFTCTVANPCTLASAATAPLGRAAGGEPLSTVHLHDFSATPATNGEIPIWNSTLNQYVPGPMTGTGGTVRFTDITTGTAASSQMTVGSNSSLRPGGVGGTVTANYLGAPANANGGMSSSLALPQTFTNGYLHYDGTALVWDTPAGGPGGPVRWSDLTPPSSNLNLLMAGLTTTFRYNPGSSGNPMFWIVNAGGAPNPLSKQYLFGVDASQGNSNIYPMGITVGSGGFEVDGTAGNLHSLGTSKVVSPVQLTGITNPAPSLATDVNGNIIAGSGVTGGPVSVSDLIAATKNTTIPFGQYKLTFSFDTRPPATQGQYIFQIGEIAANTTPPPNNQELVSISSYSGSTTTPLSVYTGAGFWMFNSNQQQLQARGGAKFAGPMILTDIGNPGNPIVNAAVLGTDPNGNIVSKAGGGTSPQLVYSGTTTGTLTTNTGLVISGFPITLVTPTQNTNYRLEFQLKQTNTPVACTTNGTIQIRLLFTDGDTGVPVSAGILAGAAWNAGTMIAAFAMGANPAPATAWSGQIYTFNAQAPAPVQININQTVATGACTTPPTFLLRAALYALPY